MAEIINLRRARKAKQRHEAAEKASKNRVKFGRSKAEKQLSQAEQDQSRRLLDGHEREPS